MNRLAFPFRSALILATALASPLTSAQVLDLAAIVAIARAEDASFRSALAGTRAAREAVPQARAQLLPNVALSASNSRVSLDRRDGIVSQPHLDYESANQSLTLRQSLFRRSQFIQLDQAHVQAAAAADEEAKAAIELVSRAAGQYFEVLFGQDVQGYIEALREATEGQLRAARALYEKGQGTRTDVDEAQARLDLVDSQALAARQQLGLAKQQLALTLGLEVLRIASLDEGQPIPTPRRSEQAAWLEAAEQASPALAQLRRRVEVARLDVERARAGHLPTLDLIAQRSLSKSESVINPLSQYRTSQWGIQLNVPLYAGGATDSAVRQAMALHEREGLLLEQARRALAIEVTREWNSVSQGTLRMAALSAAMASAQQLVLSTRKGVQAGTRTQTDVLNALQRLAEARRDLAQARYQYLLAWLKLHALSGDPLDEAVAGINRLFTAKMPSP